MSATAPDAQQVGVIKVRVPLVVKIQVRAWTRIRCGSGEGGSAEFRTTVQLLKG